MITPKRIKDFIENRYSVSLVDRFRGREVSDLRKMYYALCVRYTRGYNYTSITKEIDRDHSSMSVGLQYHDRLVENNIEYHEVWKRLYADFKKTFKHEQDVKYYEDVRNEPDWWIRKRILDLEHRLRTMHRINDNRKKRIETLENQLNNLLNIPIKKVS